MRRSITTVMTAGVVLSALALSSAPANAGAPGPRSPGVVTAPSGPNPYLTQVLSPRDADYAGWLTVIEARGRARVASASYAAARTAAGLTSAPPLTATDDTAATVLTGFGTAAGDNPRIRITGVVGSARDAQDTFRLFLADGDVLSAALTGPGALSIMTGDGRWQQAPRAGVNLSGLYPVTSPISGAGNTSLVHVDTDLGPAYLTVTGPVGSAYRLDVEVLRPSIGGPGHREQTVVLDVDGARVDTSIWGGGGVRTLSPLSSFLASWGLAPSQEGAVVKVMTDTVRAQLSAGGGRVKVVNTRTGADTFGQPEVSRVIIGGTRAQSGVNAIAVSQDIDPGNFLHKESSLVMLDALSAAPGAPASAVGYDDPSLNAYLAPTSDRVAFVGRALGNLALHELGHGLGMFDNDGADANRQLMDAGGKNVANNLYFVGVDRIGGTADDHATKGIFAIGALLLAEGLGSGQQEAGAIRDVMYAPR